MNDLKYIGKRISVMKKPEVTSFVISASESRKDALPVLIWTMLWTACGIFLMAQYHSGLLDKEKIFLIGFGAFWIYYEYRSIMLFLWKRQGREVLRVENDRFSIARKTFKSAKAENYSYEGIREMEFIAEDAASPLTIFTGIDFLGRKYSIRFRYFGKEVRFGYILTKDDADLLLKEIKRAMKNKAA